MDNPIHLTLRCSAIRRLHGEILPSIVDTVPVAEAIHRALIRTAAKGKKIQCPELTGQSAFGQPLVGPHQHMHVLPIDADGDGLLDHVVLHAPMGLSPIALHAIDALHSLYGNGGEIWLHLRNANRRSLNRYLQTIDSTDPFQNNLDQPEPFASQVWQSVTPFVPPRYLHKNGKNSLYGQITSELLSRNLPTAHLEQIDPVDPSWNQILRKRASSHTQPPQNVGFSLQLTFETPVPGPIVLGYASHFGLGLFRKLDLEQNTIALPGSFHTS